MSKIGYLKVANNGGQEELHGEVATLQMQLKIKLISNRFKSNDNAPDYNIQSEYGVSIGGAWKKRKAKIGEPDLEFLSITIDDPSLPNALNVGAFPNNEGGWNITWRRRKSNDSNSTPALENNQINSENN